MNKNTIWMLGAGMGAGLMYLFDPDRGRRRRALLRDQLMHAASQLRDAIETTSRDVVNRAYGVAAEAKSRFSSEQVDDATLEARVRSEIGWAVSHPKAIDVRTQGGWVTLSGPVLAHELDNLLRVAASVRGVSGVESQLQVHEHPGGVSSLQGGRARPRTGERFELMQENWSPAARLITGLVGSSLTLRGLRQRSLAGAALGLTGLALLARGATNLPLKRVLGAGAGRRAVDVQKTIHIEAPVEKVYELWSEYENFPRFMSHVREVKKIGDARTHWIVDGPAGVPVQWDALTTSAIPNHELAWKSEPDSFVQHAGIVRFMPEDMGTQVEVRLTYNPGAGGVGHAVAKLFGADPKRQLDDDLMRMKSYIETGKLPSDARE
jgi:uncharacterized membrane protein